MRRKAALGGLPSREGVPNGAQVYWPKTRMAIYPNDLAHILTAGSGNLLPGVLQHLAELPQ